MMRECLTHTAYSAFDRSGRSRVTSVTSVTGVTCLAFELSSALKLPFSAGFTPPSIKQALPEKTCFKHNMWIPSLKCYKLTYYASFLPFSTMDFQIYPHTGYISLCVFGSSKH